MLTKQFGTVLFSTSVAVAHAPLRLRIYTVLGRTPTRAKFKGTCTRVKVTYLHYQKNTPLEELTFQQSQILPYCFSLKQILQETNI